MSGEGSGRRHVAVVTGGGGGIGAAIAEELGRGGWFVVTVDPLVTLDGTTKLPEPEGTTAGRIVAAGGAARASAASVTDGEAVRRLFEELVAEHGGLDAVVNVAGITRQTGFAHGTEEDWLAVLTVHLQGYLNVLEAALPLMVAAGRGTVLGVTSGSGWRPADAGAYSCAKRVVASLAWQLGRLMPPGVTVNAMSPIAATRMVAAALERARQASRGARTGSGGGLSLTGMAGPEHLGPLGAYLVGEQFRWCTGRVVFAGGSELAMVDEPRLLEVVRTDGVRSLSRVLGAVIPRALAAAETAQVSTGGTNPRFGPIFDEPDEPGGPRSDEPRSDEDGGRDASEATTVRSCVVVSDRAALAAGLVETLEGRGFVCHRLGMTAGFEGAGSALRSLADEVGPVDAVVLAPAARPGDEGAGSHEEWPATWAGVLAQHAHIVDDLYADAAWARATADYAGAVERPVRLVTVTDATTAAGRSRAQAAVQLARVAPATTEGRVSAFGVSMETPADTEDKAAGPVVAELVVQLLDNPEAAPLAGAELVVGDGWVGLRSHPRPMGSITYGGPSLPQWLDATVREIVGGPSHTTPEAP